MISKDEEHDGDGNSYFFPFNESVLNNSESIRSIKTAVEKQM